MVQAVERAKQVTMAELNAIIGVCGLSILALIVFINSFSFSCMNSFPSGGQKLWAVVKFSSLTFIKAGYYLKTFACTVPRRLMG